ncbi:MAG: chloride channel protein [Desulfobacterales bacterium]
MFHRLVNGSISRWRHLFSRLLDQQAVSESGIIMVSALVVGAGSGLGAVFFRWLIETVQTLAYEGLASRLQNISPFYLVIIPAIGGAIYGPLIYRFAREAKGHGVPEVMEAVALHGGRIRPRVAVIKSLASALCIGTGGSIGREGPIAQIGSALGSTLGQLLRLSDERIRNLVACGAAGGIAATFNAPIAGSIFALEVILGRLEVTYFGAVVISSVAAVAVAHIFYAGTFAFAVPQYALISPWELVLYSLLGVLAAIGAVVFTRLLYASEDLWDHVPLPEFIKPIGGGLLLGILGLLTFKSADGFPRVFGVGYGSIGDVLFGKLAFEVVLGLFIFKLLATVLTLGAGGSGGIFAPSLFMGAMMGTVFGQIAHHLFPTVTAPAGAYALVGMAAFFSAAAHAPVTAILILFEMTGDYRIILPLMLATVISTLVSRILSRDSIYTLKLTRRGIHLEQGHDIDIMQGVTVGEAMSTDIDRIPLNLPLDLLAKKFSRTHNHGFAVVDESGDLAGVVSIRDLEQALAEGPPDGRTVADIATTDSLLTCFPEEPMWKALCTMGPRDISQLPVLKQRGSQRLAGLLRRRDIIQAYNNAIAQKAHDHHRAEFLRVSKLNDADFAKVKITPDSASAGRLISELQLPQECLIVSVQRGNQLIIPHGYTRLRAKDQLTIFAENGCLAAVEHHLDNPSTSEFEIADQRQ